MLDIYQLPTAELTRARRLFYALKLLPRLMLLHVFLRADLNRVNYATL